MSTNTAIQWTTHSWNPWWGCVKVAQGCRNCYAEGVATRFYGRRVWGPNSERRIASAKVWNDPVRWSRAAERAGVRARVFCLSMGDILEDHPALVEPRKRAVGIIESTPWLDWQLLTKRPENAGMFGWGNNWPANVWFGASAATHAEMYANAPHLLNTPAAVRFWSLEPLIGEIVMTPACMGNWVIVGGESGHGARPCDVSWVRSIVRQCRDAGVPVFVKQLGRFILDDGVTLPTKQGFKLERTWLLRDEKGRTAEWSPPIIPTTYFENYAFTRPPNAIGFSLNDPKGGDWSEWPEDLRVRQFPMEA